MYKKTVGVLGIFSHKPKRKYKLGECTDVLSQSDIVKCLAMTVTGKANETKPSNLAQRESANR
jgi:hypothetical protein